MNLQNSQLIGFGIHDAENFNQASEFAKGGIIGSAFINHLTNNGIEVIDEFVKGIRS